MTFEKWDCKWTWNWSESFEPVNITGYCIGNKSEVSDLKFQCNHPVQSYYLVQSPEDKKRAFVDLVVLCGQEGHLPHKQMRAKFEIAESAIVNLSAKEAFETLLQKAIDSERDIRVAHEIRFLRRQFWR